MSASPRARAGAAGLAVALLAALPTATGGPAPGGTGETPAPPSLAPLDPAGGAAEPVATFSIVGFDPATGDLGVAVQSKFFAVGSVVPWAEAGVGAIATQSYANTRYGPEGLALLRGGATGEEALQQLTAADAGAPRRQAGIVDARGRPATFTGDACLAWAGGRTGEHYAAQGNILAGPGVVDAMALAFEATPGSLAERLVAALAAGEAAGGDARGRQSAALLVVREGGGYQGLNDRYVDLRVDDHPAPIAELRRLLGMRLAQVDVERAATALSAGDLDAATLAATRATTASPADSGGWLVLAGVHLQRGDRGAAIAAAREALVRDPWIKQGIVDGVLAGSRGERVITALLTDEAFARFWATIPSRR